MPHPWVLVTRKARFSAAHFYRLPELSDAENEALFKACSNPYGHGHNYGVELTVGGCISPETGMVVNLKDLKQLIQEEILAPFDHKHLNHQVPAFDTQVPTLENLTTYVWKQLQKRITNEPFELTRLKLVEEEDLYVEYEGSPLPLQEPMILFTRRYDFCASHRLYNPAFSESQNWEVFRECNNPNGHGHNYELEVTLTGPIDTKTGMVLDLEALDQAVQRVLIQHVDHKHLNLDVPFLQGIIPTAENIVWAFWQQLAPAIPQPAQLVSLRLHESKNNIAEYRGQLEPTR